MTFGQLRCTFYPSVFCSILSSKQVAQSVLPPTGTCGWKCHSTLFPRITSVGPASTASLICPGSSVRRRKRHIQKRHRSPIWILLLRYRMDQVAAVADVMNHDTLHRLNVVSGRCVSLRNIHLS